MCPSCGTPYEPGERFCDECGAGLDAETVASPRPAPTTAVQPTPTAERRLVTVLFADLVGFTTLSESRDAEEVRELLSRYFDTCRRLIERYGGTVEKFIGDAVMAVWGAPVAQEDDAERAVRTALDLVAAVSALGDEVGASELRARAGVLTGEAAVTLGAEGQGMVAGDLVNTASRIQATAQPGDVLVGESTKRATEAAIAYEDAGSHELKGKEEPVRLSRALRVTAARGGAQKSAGLEPPFVGRDRELRLVKDLFHASAEEKTAQLVSVVGIAGIGKSRLAWEFEKYIDGVLEVIWWHRGRCLAYGEGVTYWALAEMVRRRADIVEGEEPASARDKLRQTVGEFVNDADEERWVEPRLAHLLGLEERETHEREDLFGAWRLFFERLAEQQPTILVFEDMQWADASLLEFVEHLLEWSRNYPIFVLCLARPELSERHPGFAAGKRNFTALYLEPLSDSAMQQLLTGLVPGLPDDLKAQILERAEGVPLYAVETVRMLLDRGLLEQSGEVYKPTGEIERLDVPETLHALIAARLDGLSPEERGLLQHAAVLGKTFTKEALAELSGTPESEVQPLLQSLVRKEVLSLQADPRSPERGQYGFLQDLLKHVAYETLSRRDRKARHLAAAAYLEQAWGPAEQEIVEVVASHYLAAYEAAPDADDADDIKERARTMLCRAGERAASLGANLEAERYFAQAADLADDPLVQAELLENAGERAWLAAEMPLAAERLGRALALFEADGAIDRAARVTGLLGAIEWRQGRLDQALERMEAAFAVLSDATDRDVATLAARLASLYTYAGKPDLAQERADLALRLAEALWLPEVLCQALNSAGLVAIFRGCPEHGIALLKHSSELALEHGIAGEALRANMTLGDLYSRRDRYENAIELHREGLALARKVGDRRYEWNLLSNLSSYLAFTGHWEEALELGSEVPEERVVEMVTFGGVTAMMMIAVARGDTTEVMRIAGLIEPWRASTDVQDRTFYFAMKAIAERAAGNLREAVAAADQALAVWESIGVNEDIKAAFVEAVEALLGLGEVERAEQLVARVERLHPGESTPVLTAHALRFRGRLAAASGELASASSAFKRAEATLREYGLPFWLGATLVEHAESLLSDEQIDEARPLLAEAREIFERLEATPWLERVDRALPAAEALATS